MNLFLLSIVLLDKVIIFTKFDQVDYHLNALINQPILIKI